MREIKFRAWDTVEKKYRNFDSMHDTMMIDESGKIQYYNLQNGSGGDEYVLEQFTGIKDKHGKMIFEGDIVKITDHTIEETFENCGALVTMLMTRTYEVFWNVIKWSIKSLEPMLAVDPPIFDLPTSNVTYEIIGNIHDQKEDV